MENSFFSLELNNEVMTGTTIFAMKYKDGVLFAADSRTSTGTVVANRITDKLTYLTDNIYCCRSGSAADTQAIADMVKYYLRILNIETEQMSRVETAARLVANICYEYRDRMLTGMIVGGWDKNKGGQVFAIPHGGTLVEQKWTISGSGSTFIYGFCDEHYRSEMSLDEALTFVRTAIGIAIFRDGSSGGICRTAALNSNGIEKHIFNIDKKEEIKQ